MKSQNVNDYKPETWVVWLDSWPMHQMLCSLIRFNITQTPGQCTWQIRIAIKLVLINQRHRTDLGAELWPWAKILDRIFKLPDQRHLCQVIIIFPTNKDLKIKASLVQLTYVNWHNVGFTVLLNQFTCYSIVRNSHYVLENKGWVMSCG